MILDGKLVAQHIKTNIKKFIETTNANIELTIFQVGDNPASNTYIRNKVNACTEVGIKSSVIKYENPGEFDRCCDIPDYLKCCTGDGVMLQLPLPQGWDEDYFVNQIDAARDADCLTTANLGKFYSSSSPDLAPCTAQGVMDLLDFYNIELEGKRALVIGRSNIVGKPVAHLLETRNATVTLAHSRTPRSELLRLFLASDVVILAVGKPEFITEDEILEYQKLNNVNVVDNRVIVDVGINRNEAGKLCGDLSEEFKEKFSSAYSPVPGGIGPLTVANLLQNTVKLYKQNHKHSDNS